MNVLRQQPSVTLQITVSPFTLAAARRSIHACDTCSEIASIPFAQLLDRLTGHFDSAREYLLADEVQCPVCEAPIADDTLVELHTMTMAAKA